MKKITIERIIELKREGLTLEQIAEKEGVSCCCLNITIKESKGTKAYIEYKKARKKQTKRKAITIERIIELSEAGLKTAQIAKEEGVTTDTINSRIKEAKGTEAYKKYIKIKKEKRKAITIERIIELSEAGLTPDQIAKEEGVSTYTVWSRISELKGTEAYKKYIKIKKEKRKAITIERIIELSEAGLTPDQIAKEEGVSTCTVWRRISELKGTEAYKKYIEIKKERIRKEKRKAITIERIVELSQEGLTLKQIAEKEGVSVHTLCNRISEAKETKVYEEYKAISRGKRKKKEISGETIEREKTTEKQIKLSNKQLILFMLENGATVEETSKVLQSRGVQINVRKQLEEYMQSLSGRRASAIEKNMISYVKRLLHIQAQDVAELEQIVTNNSPIHRITGKTMVDDMLGQYNKKSGRNFSKLEVEFALNRIKSYNAKKGKHPIEISPFLEFGTERVATKIEDLYDSIELDSLQTLTGECR